MGQRPRQDLVARAQRFSVRLLRLVDVLLRDPYFSRRVTEQLAAAGTAIGNNLSEAQSSLTRPQMIQVFTTALREAREAKHCLDTVRDLRKGDPVEIAWLHAEADQFAAILFTSLRSLRNPPGDAPSPARRRRRT
jgi:four helix bundle protein